MTIPETKPAGSPGLILIPVDFSPVCEIAIDHGAELASRLNYNVCLLHILAAGNGISRAEQKEMTDNVRHSLNEYRKIYEAKYNLKINILVRKGNILQSIRKVSAKLKPALMVMGTHGKSGLQHLFGSYALKLVLDAPCPVLVVQHRPLGAGYGNILLPVSMELEVNPSFDWICRLCSLFGSDVHLYGCPETDPEMKNQLEAITKKLVTSLQELNKSCHVTLAPSRSDFNDGLIRYSESVKADLIIITTMPCGKVPGFEFSTWVERIIFNPTHIPVMCINPE
jgi:nucleotide-binding universal stress UspA family protein